MNGKASLGSLFICVLLNLDQGNLWIQMATMIK